MTVDQAQIWNSLSMPVIMVLNLMVSTGIAVLVFRFTRKQALMEALKLVHSRWHEINKLFIEKPRMQRLLDDARFVGKSDDEIAAYNLLFQLLNVTYEVHYAAAQGLIDRRLADQFIAGNAKVLQHRREDVLELLTWSRGYDDAFCQKLRELIAQNPRAT